eukprot:TRINITY_DN229_c0_g1_i6.p1 TRINITY_DN229_c0_g1~~TRINITY_DN229_c0_g1_i6.p1  ORF type:complete len:999 (+),score=206.40 TRINITY_DN229_c0_g1_i6:190-3186(+)
MNFTPREKYEEFIDERLYSRQLYVIGHESMKNLRDSRVLIVGMRGLGAEIAKNLVLMGLKSVIIHDDGLADLMDLSTQFLLSTSDVGKPRALASLPKLSQYNHLLYVDVGVHCGPLDANFVSGFTVVVTTNLRLEEQIRMNEMCRSKGVSFINADTMGVFCSVFCDFGDEFLVKDKDEEEAESLMITNITQSNPGIVTVGDECRIKWEEDKKIVIREVKGMTQINDLPPQNFKRIDRTKFSIGDTSSFSPYEGGGIARSVGSSLLMHFDSMRKSMENPKFQSDCSGKECGAHLHIGFQAIHLFLKSKDRLPLPQNKEDYKEVLEFSIKLNEKAKIKLEKIDENLIQKLSFGATGDIAPMTSLTGGFAAQEVLKACTGRFTPLNQWFYYHSVESLPPSGTPDIDFEPTGTRYDGQIAVLGRSLTEKIHRSCYFLVGSGGIGCEILKCWAMMGLGKEGMIHISDMDKVEMHNLNGQSLFRSADITQFKSKVAAKAVRKLNPDVNIRFYPIKVDKKEDSLNERFFSKISGVCTALDDVNSRNIVDDLCIRYKKPLFDCGTNGLKGHCQSIIPFLTESYGSSADVPEPSFTHSTLAFPNVIEHTIQWATSKFHNLFEGQLELVRQYLQGGIDCILKNTSPYVVVSSLYDLQSAMIDVPETFLDCVEWAIRLFKDFYLHLPHQMLRQFPPDSVLQSTGELFWRVGTRRQPETIEFDEDNDIHMDFIVSAATLRALNFGIKVDMERDGVRKELREIDISQIDKVARVNNTHLDVNEEVEYWKKEIENGPSITFEPYPIQLDYNSELHVDFITSASNLRALCHNITPISRFRCKKIAGKVIPSIINTSCIVAGLANLQLIKKVLEKPLESYNNGFINLSLPSIILSTPVPPFRNQIKDDWSWDLWDTIEMDGRNKTIQEIIDVIEQKFQFLSVSFISTDTSFIWGEFFPSHTRRRQMTLMEVLRETVYKGTVVPDNVDEVYASIQCDRKEDNEDVELPIVRLKIR